VSFTPRSLYSQGKNLWYPLDTRLGGPQSRSGRNGEEENFQPLLGLETTIFQSVPQRYTTELSRLFQFSPPLYLSIADRFISCVLLLSIEIVTVLFMMLTSNRNNQNLLLNGYHREAEMGHLLAVLRAHKSCMRLTGAE
jgi:hypothetical protein